MNFPTAREAGGKSDKITPLEVNLPCIGDNPDIPLVKVTLLDLVIMPGEGRRPAFPDIPSLLSDRLSGNLELMLFLLR